MTREQLFDLLAEQARPHGTELYLTAGQSPRVASEQGLRPCGPPVPSERIYELMEQLTSPTERETLVRDGAVDLTISVGGGRLRACFFRVLGGLAANVRRLPEALPDLEAAGETAARLGLHDQLHGLVVVAGPRRSGKSTTLAGLISALHRSGRHHVVTVERSIEFVLEPSAGSCVQLEVGRDVPTFTEGIERALALGPTMLVTRDVPLGATETLLAAAAAGVLVLASVAAHDAQALVAALTHAFCPLDPGAALPPLARLLGGLVLQHLLPDGHGRGWHMAQEIHARAGEGSTDPLADGSADPLASLTLQTPSLHEQLLEHVRHGRVAVEDALRVAPDHDALNECIDALEPSSAVVFERLVGPWARHGPT